MAAADDLQLAFTVSDRAAQLAMSHFGAGVTATAKDDGSPVTEADRAVERLLRTSLLDARPEDALLGEEFGHVGSSARVWIVDPIDGTGFFASGDPNWRVHVALEVDGETELAVVTAPALGVRWWAVRGRGAFETGWPSGAEHEPRRLSVSRTATFATASVCAIDDESRARFPADATRVSTSPLPLVELIHGALDAFLVERYAKWDHAPWILIVQEAGGRFSDPRGGTAADAGGGLYSNAALHDDLRAALGYPGSSVRTVPSGTPETRAMVADVARAWKLQPRFDAVAPGDFAAMRELLAELTGTVLDDSVRVLPPFHADGRHLRFGRNVFVNHGCTAVVVGGIDIGDDVMIGPNVQLITGGHPLDPETRRSAITAGAIRVGRGAWIGAGATILQGVTVGEDAVVGAGAVVTRDVPPRTFVAGVPARVIRDL